MDKKLLLLQKLKMVWLTIRPNLSLGELIDKAVDPDSTVYWLEDEELEKFLDKEIAEFTTNA